MRTETRTAPPTFPGSDPVRYQMEIADTERAKEAAYAELRTTGSTAVYRSLGPRGWTVSGPRTLARRKAYNERRRKLGTPEGRNMMVDICRVLNGQSMVRRANLDRKRGVRR